MKPRSVTPMWIAKIGYIVLSIVLVSLGIWENAAPLPPVQEAQTALGVVLLLFGCFKLVGYFSKDLYRLAFQYDLVFGILFILVGLAFLFRAGQFTRLIFAVLAVAIIADSLFKIKIAFDSRQFGIRHWWGILAFAIVTVVIALVFVIGLSDSDAAVRVLFGITLITEGLLNLFVAVTTVKIVKHQYPDNIDVEYYETEDKK